ncbi:MAG TPA: hypothetical protein VKZ96_13635 [Thermomicrobiales bacterium]|nr:hypothetical protein [Thermomicrobiales bacterium]
MSISFPQRGARLAWILGRGNVQSDRENFFVWQEKVLDLLLAWGLGNVLAGSVLAARGSRLSRAIGVQAILWGAVDTAVAAYAGCIARRHATSARSGMFAARHVQQRARRFERLMVMQVAADVLYVGAGAFFTARWRSPWLKGTAIGVLIQGSALLLYDAALYIRLLTRPELRVKVGRDD